MRNFTSAKNNTPKSSLSKPLNFLGAIVLGLALGTLYYFYDELYGSNVKAPEQGGYIYIPTGSTKDDVIRHLASSGYIENMNTLRRAMNRLEYGRKVYPGRFKLVQGMSNKKVVRMLASNMQYPVDFMVPSVRTRERLAGTLAKQVEPDSMSIILAMTDETMARKYGFNTDSFFSMFVPNKYQVYWNISLNGLFDRMNKEWENFWRNNGRDKKLKRSKLSREQVVVLASIVCEETTKYDEMPTVAGVYINRLNKGIRLQADPTVRYAMGDFSVHRILASQTKVPHNYNTYRIKGLPPGPICTPDTRAIDAVLNYEQHDYLYFCARSDFSGYHAFAKTYEQHIRNAQEYQRTLNRMQIFR
ncbi:MAG: endolytic transglycosylase MltG [Prevotellaceae bacterium]|jgi:UPF0755 protein|nr:endolytic transglycosylase MltG [Prevotellaceae bacterium]